jgi:hypothetical protein
MRWLAARHFCAEKVNLLCGIPVHKERLIFCAAFLRKKVNLLCGILAQKG